MAIVSALAVVALAAVHPSSIPFGRADPRLAAALAEREARDAQQGLPMRQHKKRRSLSRREQGLKAAAAEDTYQWVFKPSLTINASNAVLKADAFVPVPKTPGEKFPVIVFANSWGVPQIEYILRCLDLAERGYVALEYETRGWWSSTGEIDTAGPLDRADGSKVIDFVEANAADWNADLSRLAFSGISYGSGISLMMAAVDPRVTTAVAMSSWNNITYMLYGNETPNKDEIHSLLDAAQRVGHPAQELAAMADALLAHRNFTFFEWFANQRSPDAFLPQLNARKVPLFISANYQDALFRPQYMLDFFGLIEGPKRLLMNQGGHAFPEALGLVLEDNYIWNHAYAWFDHWLKNASTGILSTPEIQMQQGPSVSSPYVAYSNATKSTTSFFLAARPSGGVPIGTLATSAPVSSVDPMPVAFVASTDVITFDRSPASRDLLGEPYIQNLVQSSAGAFVYASAPLSQPINLCGTPRVDLTFTATADDWQFYSFLYDVAPGNATFGSLLSHGFYTHFASGPTAGPAATRNADGSWTVLNAALHTICRVVEAGHSLAVAFVPYSPAFTPAGTNFSLAMHYGPSSVTIPIISP